MSGRARSNSAVEEAVISDYIKTCVNYKSNIRLTDVETAKSSAPSAEHVLVIGTEEQLKHKSVKALPIYCPVVEAAIGKLDKNTTKQNVLVQLPGQQTYTPVTISAIPTKAARTNCPYRPDVVTQAVRDCVAQMPSERECILNIYVRAAAEAEMVYVSAIARASPHSYSAKKGSATKAYLNQSLSINVILATHTIASVDESGAAGVGRAEMEIVCNAVQLCQRLVDTPTNILDTVVFAEIAQSYATMLGADATVIRGDELREAGYGGIYAVGKGAQYPPHLVTLRYENKHASEGAKNVALVGKGIVYDCGGLGLKTAAQMVEMKIDMGGAAAVLTGYIALVQMMQLQSHAHHYSHIKHLSVTLCLAENAIGPNSYRNGDIIVPKSGKTVEVIHTDAEGRIVLADGVYFATNEQPFVPDVLIDMATLTGAQGIATGMHHAALYVSDGKVEQDVVRAGNACGDTCCPVLYCPEYHAQQYTSPHADMRNLMLSSTDAGVSCGGYFVEQHISERFKGVYIHVDIAFPTSDKVGATGYGPHLLCEYCKNV